MSLSPIFFDRYSTLFLSYAFLRERIINNNTLSSQLMFNLSDYIQNSTYFTKEIEEYYYQSSIRTESRIQELKNENHKGLQPLIDFSN